jgi:hypothetical protein
MPAATAAAPGGNASNKDSVHGGGELGTALPPRPPNHFAINAQSGPNGENAFGEIHFTAANGAHARFNGDVVCLRVAGSMAALLYRVKESGTFGQPFEDGGGIIFVNDNGNPDQGDPADRVSDVRLNSRQFERQLAAGCPAPTVVPPQEIIHGNVIVNDAT